MKAKLLNKVLDWQGLQRCHHMLSCKTQEPSGEDVDAFILEQLHLACGRNGQCGDCMNVSGKDSVLLLLTLVKVLFSKNNLKLQTHRATKLKQAMCGYLGHLLCNRDMFVSYSACKSLTAVLLQSKPEDSTDGFVRQLILSVLDEQTNESGIIHTLDLLKNILDCKGQVNHFKDLQELCFRNVSKLWTKIVEQFMPISRDVNSRPSRRHHGDGILYSFLSLWAKLLKFSHTRTCQDIMDEYPSLDFGECTLTLVKCVSQGMIPKGCFSKAVCVLRHSLPTASELATTPASHIGLARDLAESVINNIQSLLASVPRRDGMLLFGVTYARKEGHGSSKMSQDDQSGQSSVDDRGLHGVTLLVIKSCAVTMTCLEESQQSVQLHHQLSRVTQTLKQLQRHIEETVHLTSSDHWVTSLFVDQDDQLLEALLCLQCVAACCRKIHARDVACVHCCAAVDVHSLIPHLLSHVCWDDSVLLDFLCSPETCFLLLLLTQLHHIITDWTGFCVACQRHSLTLETCVNDTDLTPETCVNDTDLMLDTCVNDIGLTETTKRNQMEIVENRNVPCDRVDSETCQSEEAVEDGGTKKTLGDIDNRKMFVLNVDSNRKMLVSYSDSEDSGDGSCDGTCDDSDGDDHKGEIVEDVCNDSCDCASEDHSAIFHINDLDASKLNDSIRPKAGHTWDTLDSESASPVIDADSSKGVRVNCRELCLYNTAHRQSASSSGEVNELPNCHNARPTDCTQPVGTVSQLRQAGAHAGSSQLITRTNSEIENQQLSAECSTSSESAKRCIVQRSELPEEHSIGETNKDPDILENGKEVNDSETYFGCQIPSDNDLELNKDSDQTVLAANSGLMSESLDRTMAVFIRLRLKLERLQGQALFPYNARPLLRLLERCEQLYES